MDERLVVNVSRFPHETIDGETILIDSETGHVLLLTSVASVLWSHLVGGASPKALTREVEARFGTEAANATRSFLQELRAADIIVPTTNREPLLPAPLPWPEYFTRAGPRTLRRYCEYHRNGPDSRCRSCRMAAARQRSQGMSVGGRVVSLAGRSLCIEATSERAQSAIFPAYRALGRRAARRQHANAVDDRRGRCLVASARIRRHWRLSDSKRRVCSRAERSRKLRVLPPRSGDRAARHASRARSGRSARPPGVPRACGMARWSLNSGPACCRGRV